ncbi:MAG: tRNA adenosine(34) deaminase TadA [Alphaproteobacteria bacterium]
MDDGDLTDRGWMAVALDEARRAVAAGEVPVGAVVVADGREVGRAHNAPIGTCDPTAHAEILALRRASIATGAYRLPGTTLYATLEPCPMCAGAAWAARVDRVVFGASDPKAGALGSLLDLGGVRGLNHRFEVKGGVRSDEAAALLREFFRTRRGGSTT